MAITDYIPNVFGYAAPTTYEGLLGMGLITPEQMKKQQNVANIQGLLGAGLALAQGMSKIGPRRSAAENILGALSGGFGAAGGAYQQGLQNVVQQQQLQSAALAQRQAVNKLKSIEQAKAEYPDLAPLADIDSGEFVKKVIARKNAKMYFGDDEQPQVQSQVQPQVENAPSLISDQTQQEGAVPSLLGVASFGAAPRIVPTQMSTAPVAPTVAPVAPTVGNVPQQGVSLVDPVNVAKANNARKRAALALLNGDTIAATFLQNEAERLDPKEQLFFRDGRLISSKRGEIANYGGGKILTDDEAKLLGLDPNRGKWTIKDNIPSLVSGTSKTRILTPDEVTQYGLSPDLTYQMSPDGEIKTVTKTAAVTTLSKEDAIARELNPNYIYQVDNTGKITQVSGSGVAQMLSNDEAVKLGLDTTQGKRYQRKADGTIDFVQGSALTSTKILNPEEAKAKGLPTDRGQVYQIDQAGKVDLVQGTVADKDKFTGEYANLALTMFGTSDISKLSPEQRAKVDREAERRGISKAKASSTVVYPPNSMPLGKEGTNKVDTQLLELGQGRLRLQSISSNFNPKFLETPFKLRMDAVAQLEKLGKKPSPQDAADLAAYSEFAQNAYNELNAYINLITGAAVGSGDEEARLRKGVPDPQKDSPTQFLTKLNTKIKEGRLYEARLGYIKNKGMKITDAGLVDVNQIPTLMRNREADLKKTNRLFGNKEYNPNDPNHKAIVRSILAQEFGLVD